MVAETITFAYSGSFQGAFREIPLRRGESIDRVSVSERGTAYRPGAPTEIGSTGDPGTFGVADIGDGVRVVWHYRATDELRAFTIRYRLRGLAVAYDDVVDVNLQVWGSEWPVGLDRLTATLTAPGPIDRAWGHPVWVRGDVTLAGNRARLRALDVPSGQFVELRALVPRSAFTSTAGMQVRDADGRARIVAEEAADAAAYQRDRDRIDDAKAHPWRTALYLLLLATVPGFAVAAVVFWAYGRERETGYDREYEQEPPSELEPALVPTLLRQGGSAGSYEFTATLFDLVRRGVYRAEPVTTERKVWGGLRSEQVADLELSAGDGDAAQALTPWERPVAAVVDHVLDGGTERLSRFRDEIEDERAAMSPRFTSFKSAVSAAADARGWFRSIGVVPLVAGLVLFAAVGALLLWVAIDGWRTVYPRWSDVVLFALGVCALVNAALLLLATVQRRLWRHRAPAAQAEAERWQAFRRYLSDFPRLHEAPPATLELWERYLVYGIAFGIADRVLQGAQLHMPQAVHDASAIYWISPTSDLGGGPTALAISDLASGFGEALAPPNSGSGGGGGGFSGGGGGGGGGAW